MQHLLRKQIITGALLLCISFASLAQRGNVNQPFYDEDLFYLGFNVGFNNNYYNFNRNVEFASPAAGTVSSINPKNNISLTMGLAGTLRLSTHTLLRLNPTVVIAGSKNLFTFTRIEYPNGNPTMNAATALINIPLAVKIVSDRYNAFHYTDIMRHYIFVGGKIDYDLVGPNGSIQNSTSGAEPIYKNIFNLQEADIEDIEKKKKENEKELSILTVIASELSSTIKSKKINDEIVSKFYKLYDKNI